jgi:uncharacterized protein with ParB-like and HNH nuclease domain
MSKSTFDIREYPTKTLSWWFHNRDNIDFDPEFQRKSNSWTQKQKVYLIDSILNGFDIPKLYVADFSFIKSEINKSNKIFAIVDGKQRLNTIFSFMNNEFKLTKQIHLLEHPSISLDGVYYTDLHLNHPQLGIDFDNYTLTIMSIITDNYTIFNQMFVRLNSGLPLKGAEIRKGAQTAISEAVNIIAKHPLFSDPKSGINHKSKNPSVDNESAKILYLAFMGDYADTKKSDLDEFVFNLSISGVEDIRPYMNKVLDILDLIHANLTKECFYLRRVSDFTVVFLFVLENRARLKSEDMFYVLDYIFFELLSPGKEMPDYLFRFFQSRRRIVSYSDLDISGFITMFRELSRSNNDRRSIYLRVKTLTDMTLTLY